MSSQAKPQTHPSLFQRPETRPFSSTSLRLTGITNPVQPNNSKTTTNPAAAEHQPKFSLKQLGATPRARAVVYTGIAALAVVEGAFYYNFTPRVFGSGGKEAED